MSWILIISLGIDLVIGWRRDPLPAAKTSAFVTVESIFFNYAAGVLTVIKPRPILMEGKAMAVSVFGMGHVGLVTALFFAHYSQVIGVENDHRKLDQLRRGKPIFYEPDLEEVLKENSEKVCFVGDAGYAVANSEISLIVVGIPTKTNDSQDLSSLTSVLQEIGEAIKEKTESHLVVIKSTILPGTTEKIVIPRLETISGKSHGQGFAVLVNPEFMREGEAFKDIQNPDKIVIGTSDPISAGRLEKFYKGIYEDRVPIIKTNYVNAELIKYAQNAFFATKISFVNSIANICEKIPGADVEIVSKAIGLDPRISPYFLRAGLGYGGSCLPKDIKSLSKFGRTIGHELKLLEVVNQVNNQQPIRAVKLAEAYLGSLQNQVVSILGLAYKPGTDDIREAPSLLIIDYLLSKGAKIRVCDPKAIHRVESLYGTHIEYSGSVEDCIEGSDCCIIVTEWEEFRNIDSKLFQQMKIPLVIDGRRALKTVPKSVEYHAIGLGINHNNKRMEKTH